jgi:CheY-like chemotaxis protein
MNARNLTLLVVDDSECDRLLMQVVFSQTALAQPLTLIPDGEQAIAYLNGDGAYQDRHVSPMPDAVLLDLNMPRKNGFEVLEWIRRQPGLRFLRVYILSASNRLEDIRRSYELGANAYLVKPGNLDGLAELARTVIAWLGINHTPTPAAVGVAPSLLAGPHDPSKNGSS